MSTRKTTKRARKVETVSTVTPEEPAVEPTVTPEELAVEPTVTPEELAVEPTVTPEEPAVEPTEVESKSFTTRGKFKETISLYLLQYVTEEEVTEKLSTVTQALEYGFRVVVKGDEIVVRQLLWDKRNKLEEGERCLVNSDMTRSGVLSRKRSTATLK